MQPILYAISLLNIILVDVDIFMRICTLTNLDIIMVKRLLLIGLVSSLGCTGIKNSPVFQEVAIPYDSSKPKFATFIEEIKFIADLDNEAFSKLCSIPLVNQSTANSNAFNDLASCRGEMQCYPVEAEGYRPAYDEVIYSGEKIVPSFRPEELRAKFVSALGGIANIVVITDPARISKGMKGPYFIRAYLTEFNISSDKNASGFGGAGVGPLAIFQMFSVEKKQSTGFVRIDFRVHESRSGRIVSAFTVAGSSTDAYVSETLLSGSISETKEFVPLLMQQATRAALDAGARRVYQELSTL